MEAAHQNKQLVLDRKASKQFIDFYWDEKQVYNG